MSVLKHVFRRLAAAPMFSIVALVTLALGIGANTAIFSVIEGVLIKPLPYPHAEALVEIRHVAPGMTGVGDSVDCSSTMYFTYREQSRTFQDFGLWFSGGATVTGVAEPEQLRALSVTYGTPQALDVEPLLGRWFSPAEDTPGAAETVILSYGYWQRRFGGDKSAIGRIITVNAEPHTVIGVTPESFGFGDHPDLILPLRFDRNKIFLGDFGYQGIARLKPGITLQQASADVARMLPGWLRAWPTPPGVSHAPYENARFAPQLQPLKQAVVGNIGTALWLIMGTLGFVLLIACANVANLLLARAEGRQQEFAIRAALGAGWGRIAREMLIESLTLGALGGALGLGVAYGAVRMLVAKGPATLPRLGEISVDPLVLAFALAASLLSGMLFGIIPVMKFAGPREALSLTGTLRGVGRSFSQSRERHRASNALVIVQVALALVLLVGSGLMIRTFRALRDVQPGFVRPEEIQLLHVFIPPDQAKEPDRVMRIQNAMLDQLAAIPGVTSVGFASAAPLEVEFNWNDVLYAEDHDYAAGQITPIRRYRFVTPGFFKTVGTAMIAGRDFTWTDLYDHRHVAMVSENLARETWGEPALALGKRIRTSSKEPWREIVGVVGDVYDDGPQQRAPAFAYWPALMDSFYGDPAYVSRFGVFTIRSNRAASESFLQEARQAIWSVNANLPVFLVRTLEEVYDQSMARTSFTLVLLAIAGAMALVLGVVGIYGVIAYAVSQRTREIGIRMALGAQPAGLQRMFVRHGLVLASIGAAVGLAAAAGLTRLMSTLLFGIKALDPVTYAAVAALLIGAAALASYLPARRATKVDPVEALRAE